MVVGGNGPCCKLLGAPGALMDGRSMVWVLKF